MKRRILVIGDTIIDRSHWLRPSGFSLETPTIKCDRIKTRDEFGGAANVAKQLAKLNCEVTFVTSVGDELVHSLESESEISVIQCDNRSQLKERFYLVKDASYKYLQINDVKETSGSMPEIDFERYDSIVLSDYRLGVITDEVISRVPKHRSICQMQISDSSASVTKYRGFHAFVGNESEVPASDIVNFTRSMQSSLVVCTRGRESVLYSCGKDLKQVSVKAITPKIEVHGAGDAFLAGFSAHYCFSPDSITPSITEGCKTAYSFLMSEL
jgi:bifunctional ADP-heptose synthase (sugar kinase/adenylyltransferase)